MKLPNGNLAVVDIVKVTDYCLSTSHPRGRHKAKVFAATLGLTADRADLLRDALLGAAQTGEAAPSDSDEFGQRYVVDFTMKHSDREAKIRSAWMVRAGEDFPRLTSCYVL